MGKHGAIVSDRRPLSFGLCTDQNAPFNVLADRWQLFENLGFESAWVCDHLIQPSRPTGPYFEAWTLLAALATRTSRLRLGVLVSANTFRHPVILAKQAITLDHISNGRIEVGLGAGWFEPEHAMFGISFPARRELVDRFKESVQVLDTLLSQDVSDFGGQYYQLRGARSRPAAIQRPRPPLVLGAFGPRMLKIASHYADTWTAFGSPGEMTERNDLLDYYCTVAGRDPNSLNRLLYVWNSAGADPWESPDAFVDLIGPYLEAGMNCFVFDQPRPEQLRNLEKISTTVLPNLRKLGAESRRLVHSPPSISGDWSRPASYV